MVETQGALGLLERLEGARLSEWTDGSSGTQHPRGPGSSERKDLAIKKARLLLVCVCVQAGTQLMPAKRQINE